MKDEEIYSVLTPKTNKLSFILPEEPSDDELALDWTLGNKDKIEIFKCRGDDNRRRFAIQLCVLRKYGRFLDSRISVPIKILNYLSRQLELNPVLFLDPTLRLSTESDYQQRIMKYLGYKAFDDIVIQELKDWILSQMTVSLYPSDLETCCQEILQERKIVLPGISTLTRIIHSAYNQSEKQIFDSIVSQMSDKLKKAIDDLLKPSNNRHSQLFLLAKYPPEGTAYSILAYLEKYQFIESIGIGQINLSYFHPRLIEQLAGETRNCDKQKLSDFQLNKKYSMIGCFLYEIRKTILDHLADMYDSCLITQQRHAKRTYDEEYKRLRKDTNKGIDKLIKLAQTVIDVVNPSEIPIAHIYNSLSKNEIRLALDNCRQIRHKEEYGSILTLANHYSYLRRFLPEFFRLPFQSEKGGEHLLKAIDIIKKLDKEEMKEIPTQAPTQFVPKDWLKCLRTKDGKMQRNIWELALAYAIKDALRSGDLFLPDSRHHVSFWNMVYSNNKWEQERKQSYINLGLPNEFNSILNRIQKEFDEIVSRFEQGLPQNKFAQIENGKLKTKREDPRKVPASTKKLRQLIESNLPTIRIEDLLHEVDSWCHFTQKFEPINRYEPRSANYYISLLAALIAHGTNLGIAAMGQSAEGITIRMLQQITRNFIREETLKAANTILVNFHHGLPISITWGLGEKSSSDGQRFGIQQSSLLASFYPRYFGYYDRAITIYTHISDQYSVYSTLIITCSDREALYVLDGILANNSILGIKKHYTDTHGFTEQVFGLCYLLGYSFMPRIKDFTSAQLYKIDKSKSYGKVDCLFDGAVDINLIREQWDQLVRLVASLKAGLVPPHVIMQRLINASPADRLAKALTALGRIIKTVYIFRYIQEPELRSEVRVQLNRGEYRHSLARHIFFSNQGIFRRGDYSEIMNKASSLSLLSNAILIWNTVKIAEIIQKLQDSGQKIKDEDLARISPLMFSHIIPNGTYHFKEQNYA